MYSFQINLMYNTILHEMIDLVGNTSMPGNGSSARKTTYNEGTLSRWIKDVYGLKHD